MTATRTRAGSWRVFERRFRPITRDDDSLLWDYRELPQPVDARRLWTVVDCNGKLYLAAGFHYVNRIGYVRCELPWSHADALRDYRYD